MIAIRMPYVVAGVIALIIGSSTLAADEVEKITITANRATETINQQMGSVSVIGKQALDLVDASHIQQSLNQVAGVNFARGNGQEYLPSLRSPVLTGAGACGSVLSAVDGVPLRAAGFCNINELFDAPFEFAQQIEVLKGAWSTFYGSNAMNGVINVISPDIDENDNSASLSLGAYDYQKTQLSHNLVTKEHGWRLDFTGKTHKGWRQDSGYDAQKINLKHQTKNSNMRISNKLSISNLNQQTAGYIVGTDSYRDPSLAKKNPNPEAFRDAKSVRWKTNIQPLSTKATPITWHVTPYARYTQMTFLQHFLPGQPLEKNGHSSLGVQSKFSYKHPNNSYQKLNMTLSFGLDLEYSSGFLNQFQAKPTQGSNFLQATIPQGLHYDYKVDVSSFSPYLQYQTNLTEQLTLQGGLRFEKVKYDYTNKMISGRTDQNGNACGFGGCRYSRPEDRTDTFNNWSPKIGLVYNIQNNQQIYFNLSQGFRAPQTTELYRLQRAQQVADLKSEKLNSVELGSRGRLSGMLSGLNYELSVYSMKRKNVIIRDSDFFNVTGGETNSHGAEVYAKYTFADKFKVSATLNYADHTYGNTPIYIQTNINGNQVDSAPKFFGQINSHFIVNEQLLMTLSILKQGRYYTDAENMHEYAGHTLTNLTAQYQITPDITLNLRWLNILDKAYANRADYSTFSGDRYFPGEPSSVYTNIQIRY